MLEANRLLLQVDTLLQQKNENGRLKPESLERRRQLAAAQQEAARRREQIALRVYPETSIGRQTADISTQASSSQPHEAAELASEQQAPLHHRQCTIDLDTKPAHLFSPATSTCVHPQDVCTDCQRQYLQTHINAGQVNFQLPRCVHEGCGSEYSLADIARLAGSEYANRADNWLLLSALNSVPGMRWCAKGCGYGSVYQGNAVQRLVCPVDGAVTCLECNQLIVSGSHVCHEQDVQWMQHAGCKRCPNPSCRRVIEKNGGCDNMTCRCGHSFKWSQVQSV